MTSKRQLCQYYTEANPFTLKPFVNWMSLHGIEDSSVLEPFAGANNIIHHLQKAGFAKQFKSYDIEPKNNQVEQRDCFKDFPIGNLIITNPPWLAKNSAKRRNLEYPLTTYDDLYKYALYNCLEYGGYIAVIIPATFLQSGLFQDRLHTFILLHDKNLFTDTDNPAALALFTPQATKDIQIYHDDDFIGLLSDLRGYLPSKSTHKHNITFNAPDGELGFIAFDNTTEPSIRFCRGDEVGKASISHSSRMITRIKIDGVVDIKALNNDIKIFRQQTHDTFLTPFKGIRSDGAYRRRMDYSLARRFIENRIKQRI